MAGMLNNTGVHDSCRRKEEATTLQIEHCSLSGSRSCGLAEGYSNTGLWTEEICHVGNSAFVF